MKKLGQHFLKNQSVVESIINSLDLKTGETVIEIGPGKGALTEKLVQQPIEVLAIEKDRQLLPALEKLKSQNSNLKTVEGDILKLLPELHQISLPADATALQAGNLQSYKLVGNIPYYITGHLLRVIGELENKPSLIVLTIQKEVAERLTAQPPQMNLLAASVQIWAQPEIIRLVPPTDFEPAPKVWSAVVRFKIRDLRFSNENYYKLIKIIFKQPRKIILNNLSDGLGLKKDEVKQKLRNLELDGEERPQNLSLELLLKLTTIFTVKS